MKKFQKISQKVVIALAILWVLLLAIPSIPLGYRYIYVGALIFYLGIQNILLLNIGQRTGVMPDKLLMYQQRLGERSGVVRYGVVAFFYIVFGVLIIYGGYQAL